MRLKYRLSGSSRYTIIKNACPSRRSDDAQTFSSTTTSRADTEMIASMLQKSNLVSASDRTVRTRQGSTYTFVKRQCLFENAHVLQERPLGIDDFLDHPRSLLVSAPISVPRIVGGGVCRHGCDGNGRRRVGRQGAGTQLRWFAGSLWREVGDGAAGGNHARRSGGFHKEFAYHCYRTAI